ncbi:MAG: MerR family transcriptional regulator, partial [bacterium]|nr:MerR family transcriptional regulator [bacterium]
RKAGLALEDIRLLLDSQAGAFNAILEKRLEKIDETMSNLRNQQKVIVALLKKKTKMITTRSMNEEQWEGLLKASGFDEAGMRKWHVEFERMSPQAHQDFLESLGIEEEELNQIRRKSREVWPLADGE